MKGRPFALILVQNLPLPGDRRVWLECKSLRDAGFDVAAITPSGPGDAPYQLLEGVHLFKYKPPKDAGSTLSFIWEFIYCWVQTLMLTVRVWKRIGKFDVIQSCNPPDTFFLIALLFRPFGVKFVFDQHDLNPEVYESRFKKRGIFYAGLKILERLTYKSADEVVVTNESYAEVANRRGRVPRDRITVVRTGPDTNILTPREPDPKLKNGRDYLVHFHGVMGPQDGVDLVIEAARILVFDRGRTDIHFSVLGKGDSWAELTEMMNSYSLSGHVYMPGRVSDSELFAHLSTADLGLSADPPNPLNDVSTMNKTMEYMAFGVPVVAFDLKETRVSAGSSAVYVETPTAAAYADEIERLLAEPELRRKLSEEGTARARSVLDWKFQETGYVSAIRRAVKSTQFDAVQH